MKNIKQLKNILPICYDGKKLRLISFFDIDWYTDNCRKAYYENYMDFKFSTDISREKLELILNTIVHGYITEVPSDYECRLVLCIDDEIIGGITINDREPEILELGYFVIPKYSSKGVCYQMLNRFIEALNKSAIPYKKIKLIIREDNIASIKVAEKLRFELVNKYKGKYKNNLEYILER